MHSRLLSGFSESMLSAMENISLGRDSHHHYHHQQLHHGHDDQHHRQLPENEKPQLQVGVDRKKPRTITGKSDDDGEMVQMLRKKIPTPTEDQVVSPTSRICGDCRTSKTPLWRSGPDGPKSLCNACGIRYRKRRRTELDFLQVRVDENQRQVEENKTALLLLQGHKFEGKEEEAEAALLLMALSCGLCVHSS